MLAGLIITGGLLIIDLVHNLSGRNHVHNTVAWKVAMVRKGI